VAALSSERGSLSPGLGAVRLEWAAAGAAARGESRSGDRHLVQRLPDGALVAVVDALGHGPEAADVAEAAVAGLGRSPAASISRRLLDCHQSLAGTRGAVAALAGVDGVGAVTWLSVGNVEGVVLRPGRDGMAVVSRLATRPGILGMRLPPLHESRQPMRPGDVLLVATDGVDPECFPAAAPATDPSAIARRVLENGHRPADDGLVLAVRWSQGR